MVPVLDCESVIYISAICVGVKFVRLARSLSFSSFHNTTWTAPSIGTFVNKDSTIQRFNVKGYQDLVIMYFLVTDGWVNNWVNNWVVWFACQGG